MADSRAVPEGREATGSLSTDAGNVSLSRGAAGAETGARPQAEQERQGDVEERRETEQVLRPTTDGVGKGLVKDQG